MATVNYYYYRMLDGVSQRAYIAFALAVRKRESVAFLPYVNNLERVVMAVKRDNPQFYYLNWAKIYYYSVFSNGAITVKLNYLYKSEAVAAYDAGIKDIARRMAGDKTVENIYAYIVNNVRYDLKDYGAGKYRVNDHNVIGPLFEKTGVCEGISKAVQLIVKLCGGECTVLDGKAAHNGGLHEWNLIKYGGLYLHFDATWDIPQNGKRVKPSQYVFFAKSEKEISLTRTFDPII